MTFRHVQHVAALVGPVLLGNRQSCSVVTAQADKKTYQAG